MDSLEQKIKEYMSSVEIPDRVKPEEIRKLLEDNGDMTAGVFLRKLKELKISGSDFLELLGNSKIGNMEFRRIEENPHLKFDELLQILDNSVLTGDDYRMIIAVATQRKELAEQRKRREEETLRRMTEELTGRKNQQQPEKPEADDENPDNVDVSENEQPVAKTENNAESEEKTTDSGENGLDDERTEAAKAMISRMQEQLDKSDDVGNVENDDNYTDGNNNLSDNAPSETGDIVSEKEVPTDEEAPDDSDEKSITQEFSLPEPPDAENVVEATEEPDDFDGVISDDEKIAGNARDIGSAIGELMNDNDADSYGNDYDVSDDEQDCIRPRRSKGCLITAFVGAAVLICGGLTLDVLQAKGIIPELIYDIPEKFEQDIDSYQAIVEQGRAAADKISYELPQGLAAVQHERSYLPKNVYDNKLTLAVSGSEILGAKVTDGKVSDNFSFDTGLEGAGIVKCGECFAVIGGNSDGSGTVVRIYDESGIINGNAVDEYILSGEYVDFYTDGKTAYLVTYDKFDIMKASPEKLTSFVPSYKHGDKTTVIPFDRIFIPLKVSRTIYYTTTAIDVTGKNDTVVRSILVGDAAGCDVSDNGMYVTNSIIYDDQYYSNVYYAAFDESLSTQSMGIADIFINPGLVDAMKQGFAAVGFIKGGKGTDGSEYSAVATFRTTLSHLGINEITSGDRIESISGKDKTVTVTTGGDKPYQYSVNVTDGEEVQKPESTNSIQISDGLTAEVTLKADKDGNRTGIVLAVGGDKKAEVTITAESSTPGDWNKYLTSPVCDDISKLAYGESGGKTIIGIPIVYFDGISQVSRCKFYSYADGKLTALGDITLYDEKYYILDCEIIGGDKPYLLTMWDNRIITASADKVKVISDTKLKTVEKKDSNTESKNESTTGSKAESTADSKAESATDSKAQDTEESKGE